VVQRVRSPLNGTMIGTMQRQKRRSLPSGNNHQARILSAAAEIFLNRGYEETSTAEIARRAKVSKRDLYSNFSDKRDILLAVVTQLQTEIQSQANISWSSDEDLRTVLTRAGTQILTFINSEKFGKLFRIVAAETFRDPLLAQRFYRLGPGTGREDTAAFIRRHMRSGDLRKADPLEAADDFLNLVVSAQHLTAVVLGQKHAIQQPRTHVRHTVDVFLNYYSAENGSESKDRIRAKIRRKAIGSSRVDVKRR
jgi:TetR/AcrR family transcriptional regulator, mexJK operon transcriptional repressor